MGVDTTPPSISKTGSETGNRNPNWALIRSSFGYFRSIFGPVLSYTWMAYPSSPFFSDVIDLKGHRGHLPGDCYLL